MPAFIQRVAREVPLSGLLFLAAFIVPYAVLAALNVAMPTPRYPFESIGTTASLQNYDRLNLLAAYEFFRAGGNPYDRAALNRFFTAHMAAGYPLYVNMLYPPWLLTMLSVPLSLPFAAASNIWFALNVFFAAIAGAIIWREVRGDGEVQRGVSAGILFLPVAFALYWGQVSLFVSAALAISFQALRLRKDGAAGFFLALATIKPTMWFAAMIGVAALIIRERRWMIAISAIAAISLFSLSAEYVSPHLFRNWLESASTAGDFSRSMLQPNLAGLVSYGNFRMTGYIPQWPQIVFPSAAIALMFWGLSRFGERPLIWWLCFSSTVSILCAPYGWFQDVAVLIVVQVALLAGSTRSYRRIHELYGSLAAVQLAGLLTAIGTDNQFAFVWFPIAIGAIFFRHQSLLLTQERSAGR